MNKFKELLKYIITDYLAAGLTWYLFFSFRKIAFESEKFGYPIDVKLDYKFWVGLAIIPFFWLFLHYLIGYYKDIYRKSRLHELGQTLLVTLIGTLVIFFALILDDTIVDYRNYYRSFYTLFVLQFVITYFPRLIYTTINAYRIQHRIIGFNTLIIGSNKKAVDLYNELEGLEKSLGHKFVGFVNVFDKEKYRLKEFLPCLGSVDDVRDIIDEKNIDEVIIVPETREHGEINDIVSRLQDKNVHIKVIPEMYEILTGSVKMSSIFSVPLIEISFDIMPIWQKNLKRFIDIVVSIFAMIFLLPLYIFLSVGVKLSSKGPILYSHERIGEHGKPFTIYKFRSMFTDAEKNGPALSGKNDNRITPFGKMMRKYRLDEFPQFYNVLIGDMSLVGPRPERQFFIDQIVKEAPHYVHLQKVKPGITSWGQVKYGYAENVKEMIERLKFDIIYLENMSLYVDFKILIYTVITVLKGRGK